jgi:hypothetical protein
LKPSSARRKPDFPLEPFAAGGIHVARWPSGLKYPALSTPFALVQRKGYILYSLAFGLARFSS